jgi:hypothetical protein
LHVILRALDAEKRVGCRFLLGGFESFKAANPDKVFVPEVRPHSSACCCVVCVLRTFVLGLDGCVCSTRSVNGRCDVSGHASVRVRVCIEVMKPSASLGLKPPGEAPGGRFRPTSDDLQAIRLPVTRKGRSFRSM